MNRVVAGDYSGYGINCTLGICQIVHGFKTKVELNSDTIESFEEVDMTEKRSTGKLIAGSMFGRVGTLLGATAKNRTHTCKIVFKDGKKSLVELDDKAYKAIQRATF